MNWRLGQWIECEQTHGKGKMNAYNGKAICVSVGENITLYITPRTLESMG